MTKRESIYVAVVLGILLLIGTFADLGISQAIYRPGTWFPRLFEITGESPGIFVGVLSCGMLIATRDKADKIGSILQLVLLGLLMVLLSLMSAGQVFHYIGGASGLWTLVLAAAYLSLCWFLCTKLDREQKKEIRRVAVIGLLLVVFAIVSVNLVKVAWGRPRFRSMQEDLSVFSHWYLPQSIAAGEEFKSFPSGHTANSAVILWITLLPACFKGLQGKEKLLKGIAYAWILCVMVSRIMAGAHFLSDVTIGALFTFVGFLALSKLIKGKKKNNRKSVS